MIGLCVAAAAAADVSLSKFDHFCLVSSYRMEIQFEYYAIWVSVFSNGIFNQ